MQLILGNGKNKQFKDRMFSIKLIWTQNAQGFLVIFEVSCSFPSKDGSERVFLRFVVAKGVVVVVGPSKETT